MSTGLRAGLTWDEAWHLSPRSIGMHWKARREAAIDHLETLTAAAFKAAVFQRADLTGDTFQSQMPKRRWQRGESDDDMDIVRMDALATRHNLQFEAKQAKKLRDA